MTVETILLEQGLPGVIIVSLGIAVRHLWNKNNILNTEMLLLQKDHSQEILEMLQQTLSSKNETRELLKHLYEVGNRDLSDKIIGQIDTKYNEVSANLSRDIQAIESKIADVKCKAPSNAP